MWRGLFLVAALASCGDNVVPSAMHDDAGAGSDAAPPSHVLGPCLDQPSNAVVQPDGKLPCELISPAFHAEAAR